MEKDRKNMEHNRWKNKKVLAIGDSITSDGRWQEEFARITGCSIETHAYGGIGIIDMTEGLGVADSPDFKYDPFTGRNGDFLPLSAEAVGDKELVIFFGAYNERHTEYGEAGDMFPFNNTLRGKFAFVIKRLRQLLAESENSTCAIMLVSPHCVGKYDWVDRDGYEDFPTGSGRSLETMSYLIKDIAEENSLYFCDAWHDSGIGRENWCIYANSPGELKADFDPMAEYTAPYPQYADQAHLNGEGYKKLGECIAAAVQRIPCCNKGAF